MPLERIPIFSGVLMKDSHGVRSSRLISVPADACCTADIKQS
jgi:hypothetical protein